MNSETLSSAAAGNNSNADTNRQQTGNGFTDSGNEFDSLAKLLNGSSTAVRSNNNGEAAKLLKLFEDLQTNQKSSNPSLQTYHFNLFERAEIQIPAILVHQRDSKSGAVFYAVILPEKLGKPIEDGVLPSNGRDQIIPRTTIDYFDDNYMKVFVEDFIISIYAQSNLTVIPELIRHSATIIIGRDADLSSLNEIAAVYDNATAALLNNYKLASNTPTFPITANQMSSKALSLVASYDLKPGATILSLNRKPLATDFTAVLRIKPANMKRDTTSPHEDTKDITLAAISGRVDFIHSEEDRIDPNSVYKGKTGFKPLWVLNSTSTLGRTTHSTDSLLQQLLSLTLVIPLTKDQSVLGQIFDPALINASTKTGIGALNWEHNPFPGSAWTPSYTEVSGLNEMPTPDRPALQEFLRCYVSQYPVIALDVEEGGLSEWVLSPLLYAAHGDVNATNVIIDELDKYFGDKLFSRVWAGLKTDMFSQSPVRLLTGTFHGADGKHHDISEIDYLAVMNHSQGNFADYSDYLAGFVPGPDGDTTEKMLKRRTSLRRIQESSVITGTKYRIFVNNVFISAIAECLAMTKLQLVIDGDITRLTSGNNAHYFNFDTRYNTPMGGVGAFATSGNNYVPAGTTYGNRFSKSGYRSR